MKSFLLSQCFIFLFFSNLMAQTQVTGVIKDADTGLPLPGVNILVVGTTSGTVSDAEGSYIISVSPDEKLRYTYVGFEDQEISVRSQTVIDVFLTPESMELDELVVTSLGLTRERQALNYSVTEVSGEEFTKAREINFTDALVGKIAGVNVTSISTGPAGASRIVIRGPTSMVQNNQPLYVVDGSPIDNTTMAQAGIWGFSDWGDGTTSINPEDIESISVLKGANASALYGSRASNGVILITTKKGKKGEGLNLELSSNFVAEKIIDYSDPQTKYGHGRFGERPTTPQVGWNNTQMAWGELLDENTTSYTFDGVQRPYVNTFEDGGNNLKKFYQTGHTWINSLAVTTGSEKSNARFSLSYLTNENVVPNSNYERLNLGLNYGSKYGNFELDSKLYFTTEDVKNRPRVSDMEYNGAYAVFMLPSSIDVSTLKGDPDKPGAIYEGQTNPDPNKNIGDELSPSSGNPWLQNPYWASYQFRWDDTKYRLTGHARARYNFTDYLFAQVQGGMDLNTKRMTQVVPYGNYAPPYRGSMNEFQQNYGEVNFEWLVGFQKYWNNFGINAFAGGNAMKFKYEHLQLGVFEFNLPYFHAIPNGVTQQVNQNIVTKGINSLFGSLELSFGGYLFLTATARNDWFSTLDPARNSILYPSVGFSWVFSDIFDLPASWNMGKIRASWAQVGGDFDPYFINLEYALISGGHRDMAMGTIAQNVNPNKFLVPLTSTELEAGFEIGLFNNRLTTDVSFYKQETTDDIIPASIANSSGYFATLINVGEIQNKGFEILLTGSPIRRSFSWDIQINYAQNYNKVIKISDDMNRIRPNGYFGESRTRNAYIEFWEGYPYSSIVGYKQDMINGVGVIDSLTGFPVRKDSLVILGNGIHPYVGGLTNTFSFKGWTLSFLIDFKFGGDIHSGTNHQMTNMGLHKQTLIGREDSLLSTGVDVTGEPRNIWIQPNQLQNYWNNYSRISDHYIYDASFVKLRQITFGYTFPPHLLNKTPFSYINLSFVGRNLFLLYSKTENIDPESTYNTSNYQGLEYFSIPPTRSYGFNLLIKF